MRCGGERGLDVAADDAAAAEDVVGVARVQWRAALGRGERVDTGFGCGERTTRIASTGVAEDGSASAPKRSLPVTLAGASSRATRAPTACPTRAAGTSTTPPAATASTASTILR